MASKCVQKKGASALIEKTLSHARAKTARRANATTK
jgi:hypothetical protein